MQEDEFDSRWLPRLARGITELGLAIRDDQQIALLRFIGLLARWNRVFNLTAVRDPLEMIPRHLLDSLSISAYLRGSDILDVGTGPGLPGIPLAITQPERNFTLVDSNGKKTRFVQQVVTELALKNVWVERIRIEDFSPQRIYHTLIVRAFAPLSDILDKTRTLRAPGNVLLAMKGANVETELEALAKGAFSIAVAPIKVPQLAAQRHLVLISPKM